jgi:hypothetical protein
VVETRKRLGHYTRILLNASSPYRRAGLLWTTFQRHYGRDDARVLVWKADTATMNPRVDPAIIAEAYEDDPESAASEYGAEFRTDIADFVSRQIVEACIERAATGQGRGHLSRLHRCGWRIRIRLNDTGDCAP